MEDPPDGITADAPRLEGIDALLVSYRASLDQLIAATENGELTGHDTAWLLDFVRNFEQIRNLTARVDHTIVAALKEADLPDALLHRTPQRVLADVLRISPAVAKKRADAAAAIGDRISPLGEPLSPKRTKLAKATAHGDISPDVTHIAVACLNTLENRFHAAPDQLDSAEEQLVEPIAAFGPKDYQVIADKIIDALFPDGYLADDKEIADARAFQVTPRKDGSYRIEGTLTGACGAMWAAILSPLAQPRPADANGKDDRTGAQRQHDAFADAGKRLLKSSGLPAHGGTPCSVIIICELEDFLNRTGHATTGDGQQISIAEALKLADEAEIYPAILTKTGEVLSLGRNRRIATASQTYAMVARDGGCSFPGCDAPPDWCERHHTIEWYRDGESNVATMTLLCSWHHDNFESKGWTCSMDSGLPEWTPPAWIDPQQKPLINARIRRRFLDLGEPPESA